MDQQPFLVNIPYRYLKDAITFNYTDIVADMSTVFNDFVRQCDSELFIFPLNEQSEMLDTSGPVHMSTLNRVRHREENTGQRLKSIFMQPQFTVQDRKNQHIGLLAI